MKSILEYEGKQIEINVPKWVVARSKWLDDNARKNLPVDVFENKYNQLQDWYEAKAHKLFKNDELFMESFNIHTETMKKHKIVDYCMFIDF